ncbi:MAG: hypothetical protein H6Q15_2174 [Bacteroidetes bacterium]|nr:hypothetical protein [Bacteroidota bacterium]
MLVVAGVTLFFYTNTRGTTPLLPLGFGVLFWWFWGWGYSWGYSWGYIVGVTILTVFNALNWGYRCRNMAFFCVFLRELTPIMHKKSTININYSADIYVIKCKFIWFLCAWGVYLQRNEFKISLLWTKIKKSLMVF